MPLKFRSIVPYTLPGVLALIGWWWYTSRKKERQIGHESSEGATSSLRTSPAEGSNGLLEKSTVAPQYGADGAIVKPTEVGNQRTQQQIQDLEASSPERRQEEAAPRCCRTRQEEVQKHSEPTVPSPENWDASGGPLADHRLADTDFRPKCLPDLEERRDDGPVASAGAPEELLPPVQVSTAAPLSDAERPEPEGEVAKHHSTTATTHEHVGECTPDQVQRIGEHTPNQVQRVSKHTSGKVQSVSESNLDEVQMVSEPSPMTVDGVGELAQDQVLGVSELAPDLGVDELAPILGVGELAPDQVQKAIPAEEPSFATPPSVHPSHHHILASTPAAPPELHPRSGEDQQLPPQQDLELVAAGLITEVISAATQEVLAVADGGKSSRSGSRPQLPEEVVAATLQRHLLTGRPQGDVAQNQAPDTPNGCSSASVWKTEAGDGNHPSESWTTPSHRPTPLLRGDEAAMTLAEDSACSTCHSEDGVSSEDLQNSTLDQQVDVIQVTHLSSEEMPQPSSLVESFTDAGGSGADVGLSQIKRLNGIGVRNGAPGMCEVDTDQSGGSDVNSMDSVDSGCTMGALENQGTSAASSGSGLVIWEIEVPKHLVGRLIGKQGRYVSFLKQNSGAKIYISTLPYTQEFQICHIEGEQQQVDKALALIGKKFKDLDLTNLYAPPPPPLTLPSLPMTSWLLLPSGVTVEVIVVNIVSAGHVFVQQHTHPTYHALRSLDQQMFLCYSQPGTPALPSPAEVGVICAAPAVDGAWWRAQVITFYKDSNEVEIRYVDYGGYDRVKIDSLRQIRSDFVTLPFQGAEVLLDNITPLPGEDRFSPDATSAFEEMTRGVALLAQVSNYDNNTGLPLVHLWNMVGDEVMSVNRSLVERGMAAWVDGF
ncbi:A kinase (PRKA) anchor protein 1b [Cololabis saira]|uniref:A kinase (PRKA) anchor protein 1b n=1 Tax=Cololabis saira TaxID=129043 RepID=UPI002AD38E33|nr:A kinase (PRKA) anchor protein 1b [Cololabis saira]